MWLDSDDITRPPKKYDDRNMMILTIGEIKGRVGKRLKPKRLQEQL